MISGVARPLVANVEAYAKAGIKKHTPCLPHKSKFRSITLQIWHTAPLLYSVYYRLIKIFSNENSNTDFNGNSINPICNRIN